jgi:uncharacterized delta-60 repeat protein
MLLLLLFVGAEVQAQSALDNFDPNANGPIRVVVVQPDGKILIGGDFTALSPNGGAPVTRGGIARLNLDGTLDTAFNPNPLNPPGSSVLAIALQPDGKILVGGNFAGIAGQGRNRIARLDGTTGLADSFNPNADSDVSSIAVQADGKILAGGTFALIGGQTRKNIARLDATTGLADSFDPNANGHVRTIALQADGKVLAGGFFTSIGGQPRNRIARLNALTGLADSFNPNATEVVYSIVVQPDGKILAGGFFSNIGGQQRHNIARLDAATGAADSLDPDASGAVFSIAIQPDGKILAGGNFTDIGGTARYRIGRFDPTTGLADSFNAVVVNAEVNSIAVQADGKILLGGGFGGIGGQGRNRIARLEADGRLDQTLNTFFNSTRIATTAIQPDGKMLVGGDFVIVGGVNRHNIARLNTDGTLDTAFIPPYLSHRVHSFALQTDGKVLVGHDSQPYMGVNGYLIRLDGATGSLDDSFRPSTNTSVNAMAVQADGKILVAGGFLNKILTRLNPDGTIDTTFNPNGAGGVFSITLQSDGKILLGGVFSSVGGQPRNNIARLNPDGTLDMAFNPNADNFVISIAVQTDNKIVVGGTFANIGGQPRNNIARLDATTGAADSFDPNSSSSVDSIALQANGKIVVAGSFSAGTGGTIGGQPRNFIARLDPTTGLADSFDPDAFGEVNSIALQADGKIVLGGGFGGIGGVQRFNFARITNDAAALQNLSVRQNSITWTRGGSSPQFSRVTFESSVDGVNYSPLGNATVIGGDWTMTGFNLSIGEHFYIRARGYYRSGQYNGSESSTESVRKVFIPRPSTLANISTRVPIQTGDNAMIGGFIITGTQSKTVIVRGLGPSLPVPGALADPVIEVHGAAGQLLATNDNWNDSLTRQQIIDSGLAPTNDLESALWGIIDPGAYTVVVRGKNDASGVGLFEVYDLAQTVDSKLANVSTRGLVGASDNVMIGGTIIAGTVPARVLVRAIGPSLTNFGIPNPLGDPILELYDGNGVLIATNQNWRDDQEAEIIATSLPPSNNLESAIVRDLLPGNYSAIVRGSNSTTGVALVEAYGVN